MTRTLLWALMLLAAAAANGSAQNVQLRGRGDIENDAFLRALLQRGDYTLVSEDRGLAATDTIRGDVLVAGATFRVDGVITGDLIIVDGDVHLRPSARVLGAVHNIGGGFYPSELAGITGGVRSEPQAPYITSRREDGVLVIIGTTHARPYSPVFHVPTYDRVNGVTARLGAELLLPRMGLLQPVVRGRVEYASQRGAWMGGGELGVARRNTEVAVGAERTTVTNERWIRGDLTNSVTSLLKGSDYRDYFEADRGYVEARRLIEEGPRETRAYLRAQVEDARALRAGTPWTVIGDFRTDNIAFANSRITSLILGGTSDWTLPQHVIELAAHTEFGIAALGGDHTFNRFAVALEWAMAGLRDHTLEIETHFQGPLPGTGALPGQRWSFVGGSSTLNTFETAEFRGDRIALATTEYSIPLPRQLRLGPLGVPSFDLLHMIGMAWTQDEKRRFEQNVGVRLSYNVVNLRLLTNPRAFSDDVEFSVGVSLPKRRYPWQEPE